MRLAKIDGRGVVEQVIVVNPLDIPSWCSDWPASDYANIGDGYVDGVFIPRAVPSDVQAKSVRQQRNTLLAASDWTQIADAPVAQAAWAIYRQALRDITDQAGFPHNITWPTEPQGV
jgi:hypothetical protein